MYKRVLLSFIIVLAGCLRFFALGQNPPSLTWDEAAWGYNAYSLSIDGKDEFGRFLPVNYIESFGDFKPPVYAYLTVLPVKVFGLNEFATRFPSALLGTITVLLTYLLVRQIFVKSVNEDTMALVSAGILAISPWHIMLSRAAFEANVATFFIVTGVWLFFAGIQQQSNSKTRIKNLYLPLAFIFFVLAMYTFNTARIVVPLLGISLCIGFWKILFGMKRQVVFAGLVGLILLLPAIPFFLSPQARLRFQEVNIFSDISIIERTNKQVDHDNNAPWSKFIHNRRFTYGVEFLKHYFDNLSPNFLFIKGDGNPKFSTQNVGELYVWEIPFFLAGCLLIFKKREGSWWLIPLWLMLGIIPAATARETPHALRTEATLPMFQIISAYGIVMVISNFKFLISNLKYRLLYGLVLLVVLVNFGYFMHGYYRHYPYEYSGEWQYGYKQSIDYVKEVQNDFDEVHMTTDLGRPYAYYLYYLKTDPEIFRKTAVVKRDVFGFVTVEKYDKYFFEPDLHKQTRQGKRILFVNSIAKVPKAASVLKTIYLLDGQPVLAIYTL